MDDLRGGAASVCVTPGWFSACPAVFPDLTSATNPIQLIGSALPTWMAVPYLLTAVGGLAAAATMNIYSSGLNLLTIGVKLERYKTVLIDAVLMSWERSM